MAKGKRVKSVTGAENYKLTDKEFWDALRLNGGLYSRTARFIEQKYQVTFTRQAVKQRAERDPEALAELEDIQEEVLDIAEESLQGLMRAGQPQTRLAAIKLYMDAKGKSRGYGKGGLEIKATAGGNEPTEGQDESPMGMGGLSLTIKVIGND